VTPKWPALDTKASAEMLKRFAEVAAELPPGPNGPARVRTVGGPRFAAESSQAVKRDIVLTFATSVLALMALFVLRFRSLRLLLLAQLPLVLGVAGGLLIVVSLQRHIHALTFGFCSVLIGVGIDYPIYLLNAASARSGSPLERTLGGFAHTRRSLGWGFH